MLTLNLFEIILQIIIYSFLIVAQEDGSDIRNILPIPKQDFEKLVHPNLKNLIKSYNLELDDVRRLYFKNDDLTKDNLKNLIDFMGYLLFI